jgi:hypothetical protein
MWVHQCNIARLSVEIGYLLKVRVVARLSSASVLLSGTKCVLFNARTRNIKSE